MPCAFDVPAGALALDGPGVGSWPPLGQEPSYRLGDGVTPETVVGVGRLRGEERELSRADLVGRERGGHGRPGRRGTRGGLGESVTTERGPGGTTGLGSAFAGKVRLGDQGLRAARNGQRAEGIGQPPNPQREIPVPHIGQVHGREAPRVRLRAHSRSRDRPGQPWVHHGPSELASGWGPQRPPASRRPDRRSTRQ